MRGRPMRDDGRLDAARAAPIDELLARLGLDQSLRRAGHEWTGPCPQCGGDDRFSVNLRKGVFNCRSCGAKGDGIALVRHTLGLDGLPAALDWIVGEAERAAPAEMAKRRAEAARRAAEAAARAQRERQQAIAAAQGLWRAGQPAEGTVVRDYLARRGITRAMLPAIPPALRFHPSLVLGLGQGRDRRELHRGPVMLAAVMGPEGDLTAVHRTWIDLGQPKGKAVVPHPDRPGEIMPAKMSLGSKRGGTIRLGGLSAGARPDTLVMGEGIETTLTARAADPFPGAAYWAGVDLGNMAGRGLPVVGVRTSDRPDLDDTEAFLPPAWCRRLIFVQDGDSDPGATRAKLVRGLRRAMALRPGLVGQIVHAGAGRDLNDVLMEGGPDEE